MEKKDLTAADVWAIIAETDRQIADNNRFLTEKLAETDRILTEKFEQSRLERQENERILNEKFEQSRLERQENERILTEKFKELGIERRENDRALTEKFEALGIKVNDIKSNVNGISDSNGEFAEEYFFTSLKKKMEFAGVHFDDIDKDIKLLRKMPNGERLKDQFDILMLNDDAVAIIEVKYTARKGYPAIMVNQKVPNFRTLFPDYANYKIYLGLGALSISKEVANEAKELGIGLLRQIGETVEYETKWVKAY